MRRVGNRLDIVGVTPWATDILRRAAALRGDQPRIGGIGVSRDQFFKCDGVEPVVAEIIPILEPTTRVLEQLSQGCPLGIARAIAEIPAELLVRDAPTPVPRLKLEEVAVFPSHCRLDHEMQSVDPEFERHLDATKDLRLDAVERDF